ncbi:MAG: STAS domain-containing protein [Solirubrobacteraceae bacterium]
MPERAAAGQLRIECEHKAAGVVLALHGELDLASTPLLERRLLEAESNGSTRLVIDLSELEFIDSSGLHALLRAHERASQNRHQLSLVRGPRAVHRMFELTSTVQAFSFDL